MNAKSESSAEMPPTDSHIAAYRSEAKMATGGELSADEKDRHIGHLRALCEWYFRYPEFRFRGEPLVWDKPEPIEELIKHIRENADTLERWKKRGEADVRITKVASLIETLFEWLTNQAASGDLLAQTQVASAAKRIVSLYTGGAQAGWEGLKRYAITQPWIPGMLSRFESMQKDGAKLCEKLRQGERYPFPHGKDAKRKPSPRIAQHALVDDLFAWIQAKRSSQRNFRALRIFEGYPWREWMHPVMVSILELPELEPSTADKWHEVGMSIVKDSQGTEAWNHSAFVDGPYAGLASQRNPWARVKEAWKLRAKEWVRVGRWGTDAATSGPATQWPPNKVAGEGGNK